MHYISRLIRLWSGDLKSWRTEQMEYGNVYDS